MTTTLDIDLTAQPASRPKPMPRWKTYLPWGLFAAALAGLVLSLAPPRTPPAVEAEPTPSPVPETSIYLEESGGLSPGPTVWRDEAGLIVAVLHPVRPIADETVTCRLIVDGEEVTAEGTDGFPAVCVWVRDAA